MRQFTTFLRERGFGMEDDPGMSLGNLGVDQDGDALLKVVRLAVESHYGEVEEFLHGLGQKDPHIQDALDDMNRHRLNQGTPYKKKKPGMPGQDSLDQVVPPTADRAGQSDGIESN